MKKILSTLALAIATLALPGLVMAQAADPKQALAAKVVALQQGPELQRLIGQLADGTANDLLQNWAPKLQANVPEAKRKEVGDALNIELKKYFDDAAVIIGGKITQASNDALVPAYMANFNADELQQLATFFESPVVKKYQAAAPELGNSFIQRLVEITRNDISARAAQFDVVAAKLIGTPAAKPAPAASAAKPAAKK
jgi:hypothetical protein